MQNFFVHVVESPSSVDLLDGRTEGRVLLESLNICGIPAAYNLVTDSNTFSSAFGMRLNQAITMHERFPIIHLSLHGNNDGIGLTDRTFVNWDTLREILGPINQVMNNGLIVCMSACYSASGCRMAMNETHASPFYAIVGHPAAANWSDAAVGFSAFYHRLAKGATLQEAVDALRIASGDPQFLSHAGQQVQQFYISFMANYRTTALQSHLTKTLTKTT